MAKTKSTKKSIPSSKSLFGPLTGLIQDPSVHEICVDGPHEIYFANSSGIQDSSVKFKNQQELLKSIQLLAKASGKKITSGESFFYLQPMPLVNVFVTLPPVALNGPTINIIKLPQRELGLSDLVSFGALTQSESELLTTAVKSDRSFLVGGITGSGKTTLLNSLLKEVHPDWRMITVEKRNDLIINRRRTVRLIGSLQNRSSQQLIRLAKEMRPDSLILSYLEQDEAWEYVSALREGFTGMTCITGENIFDCVKRLELMVLGANPHFTLDVARHTICQAFGYITFQARLPDGKRRVTDLAELVYEDGKILLKSLFVTAPL
jgi:pilus assembly protein CpaF